MQGLSIVIPTYRFACTRLVSNLNEQCRALLTDNYEILVCDDHSNDASLIQNESINQWEHCHFISQVENTGKSALLNNCIRQHVHHSLVLLIDCDAEVCCKDFIKRYLDAADRANVVCGSLVTSSKYLRTDNHLRYRYERQATKSIRTSDYFQRHPYDNFTTFNVLIHRSVFSKIKFNEDIQSYGYEDTYFGIQLQKYGFSIIHINNPLIHTGIDNNASFIHKTEIALQNLSRFDKAIQQSIKLSIIAEKIRIFHPIINLWHILFGAFERKLLCSSISSLTLFKLYKLGYYISLFRRKHVTFLFAFLLSLSFFTSTKGQQMYDYNGLLIGHYDQGIIYGQEGTWKGKIDSNRFYHRNGAYAGQEQNGKYYNHAGQYLGYCSKGHFYDFSGKYLGYTQNNHVYNYAGKSIGRFNKVPTIVVAAVYYYDIYVLTSNK